MKKIIQILSVVALMSVTAYGGLPVISGSLSQTNFNAGSSTNFFLVGINDGDPSIVQNVSISGVSSNTALLQITSIDYNNANTFATVNISVSPIASITGVVTVTLTAMDTDGPTVKAFAVNIGDFYTKGVEFKVYDMVFWQQITPVKQAAKMTDILTVTSIPQYDDYYKPAKLTVGAGVTLLPWYPNDWANFFTNAFTGYIKPLVSGTYTFKNVSQDASAFYISTVSGADIFSSSLAINCGGTACGVTFYSVFLEAGKYYPFHTADWLVFTKNYSLQWTGPGINTFQEIGPPYLYPLYDREYPTTPPALTLVNKGVQFMTLKWKSSTDNDIVAGYNLYQDGVKIASINDSLYVVTALGSNTLFSYAVTSYDRVGNESSISNILTSSTYPPDATPPLPPTNIEFISNADMSAEIKWSGATDVGSEVIGYYVYLNGNLYNIQYTTDDDMVLKVLVPNTDNTVSIEAFDGAFNRSNKSATYNFHTQKFDELLPSTGVRKAKSVFYPTAIARNGGFGMNFGWADPTKYTGIFGQYMTDLEPGVLRWGDLSANPVSFSTYVGPGKSITIGKFLQYCVDKDAYAQFTCGVEDNTDWRTNPATFTRFMEYIGDPTGQTPGGSLRVAEGYIEPFINTTHGIILEFGNEVWGGTAHNAEIGGDYTAYGQWCRDMSAVIKSSPYYDPDKFIMAYSGRSPNQADSYALHARLFGGETPGEPHPVDWLSLSGYMGGNLQYDTKVPTGDSELDYYKSSIAVMLSFVKGLQDTQDQDRDATGSSRPFYFYESNMTTPEYNGRLGQGVVMCDYFFSAMKQGVALPAIFALSGGEWSVTDASNGNAKLPFFNIAELMNKNTKGNIMKSDVTSLQVLEDENGLKISGDPVGIHVFNNGTQYGIAMFSREFDSDYQVEIVLPKNGQYGKLSGGKYTAKKYILSGSDFSTRSANTSFTTVEFKDSMIVTVPKFSVLLYVFDGPDLGLPILPLGANKYKKIDALKIIALSETSNIDVQYGSAVFTVAGLSNAIIDKRVGWTIDIPQASNIPFDSTAGIKLFGSGFCDGNGVVTITAFAMDDPSVKDQLLVTISGQVDDGLESCDPTNIKNSLSSKVTISPNPSTGALKIFSSALKLSQVDIYNTSGALIFSKVLQSGLQSHNFDLSGIPTGLYYVKLRTDSGLATRKWLKQ